MAKQVGMRGYYGIAIENHHKDVNVGTVWRSAQAFGASFLVTVGQDYKRQDSDTGNAIKHVPMFHYQTAEELYSNLPKGCYLIGIEVDESAIPLPRFVHPDQAVYLLGSESLGLSSQAHELCHTITEIPSFFCLNVAVSGSIVMSDRISKGNYVEFIRAKEHDPSGTSGSPPGASVV